MRSRTWVGGLVVEGYADLCLTCHQTGECPPLCSLSILEFVKGMSKPFPIITWTVALLSTGCGISSGPAPIGPDTYMLSSTGTWSWSSGSDLKGDLFREADKFCRGRNRQMMPVKTSSTDADFTRFAHGEVQFRCLAGDDPELRRPTMRETPTVRLKIE